ncbi:hypothetical protein PV326_012307, partial [Microctonus aethiopoides]
MAPERPDSSGMDTTCGLTVTRVFNIGDGVHTLKEADNANAFADKRNCIGSINAATPDPIKNSPVIKNTVPSAEHGKTIKTSQSDDDLTSLAWLHQQNVLKGLEISSPTKSIKDDNIINNNNNNSNINNNNVCEDSVDFSENTNSISSLDDNYFSEKKWRVSASMAKYCPGYQYPIKNYEESVQLFQDKGTDPFIPAHQSNQAKISLNNNNLPVSNRNKHPTHIPYDPHLHRSSKPPYSFSCLIFMAIEDSPVKALPVKEVYAWILHHFPYFRNAPTGWKNSVRHNLSLNKCFRKVEKAPNLGKGSLWMVDDQYRPNLIQALSRAPFPPPSGQNLASPKKTPKKNTSTRLPDPVLFPYLSKRLASSNITDSSELEFDSDVDAAAVAMLSFKHGPIILNHNKDRKRKTTSEPEKLVPVITRSSSEDHTYSCITSVKSDGKRSSDSTANETGTDVDEQRKIAEGADALLNLAGVALNHNSNSTRVHHSPSELTASDGGGGSDDDGITTNNMSSTVNHTTKSPAAQATPTKSKRRTTANDYSTLPDKRRRRWREWGDGN